MSTLECYVPGVYSHGDCTKIVENISIYSALSRENYLSQENYQTLCYICAMVDDWEVQGIYSEPMVWIGIYISVASLLCILAMVADLLHGFRNNKLWFPCKYFSLNAASITVITVAIKLPVDLSSEMPSYMDQAAKLGSLAFMCSMMANFMPSLAAMDNKTLLANIIGLSILVITIIVNVFIDIYTGLIKHIKFNLLSVYSPSFDCVTVACIYVAMILLLLIVMISSSLTIPASKEILEAKYQTTNKNSLPDQNLRHTQMSKVEKLKQHVRRYWVMAETAKEIVREINGSINGEIVENTPKELIAANSMYRVTETILFRYESDTEQINEEQLFALLIEKREASVKDAAKLLGKTAKIIESLETCDLPSMDPDKMAYIDEWRLYLKQSIP
ncbi:hypothetical protein R6Q59_021559 [Mikania micrantha]